MHISRQLLVKANNNYLNNSFHSDSFKCKFNNNIDELLGDDKFWFTWQLNFFDETD